MFNNRGFTAQQLNGLSKSKGLFSKYFFLRAFADEGGEPTGGVGDEGGDNSPQVNFEVLIANARKEEKEKLYPRIKKLEEENKALIQTNNDNLMKAGALQKELDELKANNGESQKIKDLEAELDKVKAEKKTLEESTPKEDEIRKQIEAEYEVKMYRTTKLSAPENADKVLAVFVDEVTGTTKEEIDASFDKAVEKTLNTKKQLGLVDEDGNPIDTKKTTPPAKKKTTTPPAANPSEEGNDEFDMDYVQNLDPRSKEYAEFRKKMGLK